MGGGGGRGGGGRDIFVAPTSEEVSRLRPYFASLPPITLTFLFQMTPP